MQVTLTVTSGPLQGQQYSFSEHDALIVGRSPRARLRCEHQSVSRFHFLLEINPPHCRVVDLRSRNGTYINRERVSSADLKHGDNISAGATKFRVEIVEAPDAEEPEAPEPPVPEPPASVAPEGPALATAAQLLEQPTPPRPRVNRAPLACPACGGDFPPNSAVWTDSMSGCQPLVCSACLEAIASQPQPIPGYQIIRELGRGCMGVVHLALAEASGELVALKTILPASVATPQAVERFLREARLLGQLRHPGIVAFHDVGEADGTLYFVMEYVRGTDAAALLRDRGPLPVRTAVAIICQALDALAYAHARGFVHRDVKPANLLVTSERLPYAVHLSDFGLARQYEASQISGLTLAGNIGGTLGYMPPEQILDFRTVRPPADQYGAAATLYVLLTGTHAYDLPKDYVHGMLAVLSDDPVPIRLRRPDVPEELAVLIHRALARLPEERFADAQAMRYALLSFT
jgi:serine/threonine-protein kinase